MVGREIKAKNREIGAQRVGCAVVWDREGNQSGEFKLKTFGRVTGGLCGIVWVERESESTEFKFRTGKETAAPSKRRRARLPPQDRSCWRLS